MKVRMLGGRAVSFFLLVLLVGTVRVLMVTQAAAQQQAPTAPAAPTPQAAAPFDITGYWVSVVHEDWRWRMVTPSKGDVDGINLNQQGLAAALAWDYAKDMATGNQCKAYGGAAIMRMPTRLHITWQDGKTLKVETDAGTQTRMFYFDPSKQFTGGPRTLQGNSVAQWIDLAGGGGRGGRGGAPQAPAAEGRGGAGGGRGALRYGTGTLRVVTTNLRAGYLRKNGVPYSENATVTEYFDRLPGPNNTQWLIVRTTVDDPTYLAAPYTGSSNFKLEPDASRWRLTPCEVDPPLIPGDRRP